MLSLLYFSLLFLKPTQIFRKNTIMIMIMIMIVIMIMIMIMIMIIFIIIIIFIILHLLCKRVHVYIFYRHQAITNA